MEGSSQSRAEGSENSQGTVEAKMMTSRGRTLGGKHCLTSEVHECSVQGVGEESWPFSDRVEGVRGQLKREARGEQERSSMWAVSKCFSHVAS